MSIFAKTRVSLKKIEASGGNSMLMRQPKMMIYMVFSRPQSYSMEPPSRILTRKLPRPTPVAACPPTSAPAPIFAAVPGSTTINGKFFAVIESYLAFSIVRLDKGFLKYSLSLNSKPSFSAPSPDDEIWAGSSNKNLTERAVGSCFSTYH